MIKHKQRPQYSIQWPFRKISTENKQEIGASNSQASTELMATGISRRYRAPGLWQLIRFHLSWWSERKRKDSPGVIVFFVSDGEPKLLIVFVKDVSQWMRRLHDVIKISQILDQLVFVVANRTNSNEFSSVIIKITGTWDDEFNFQGLNIVHGRDLPSGT